MEDQDESTKEVVVNGNNKNKHIAQHIYEPKEILVFFNKSGYVVLIKKKEGYNHLIFVKSELKGQSILLRSCPINP